MSIETACHIINGQVMNPRKTSGRFRGVSVDTRTIQSGNAFFCIRGARTDGHRFAAKAVRGGPEESLAGRRMAVFR